MGAYKGLRRATLFVDRRKLALYNIGVMALSILTLWGYLHFITAPANMQVIGFGAVALYLFMCFETFRYFLKPPRVDLFENGLEIAGVGYFEWAQLRSISLVPDLTISFLYGNMEVPKSARKIGAKKLSYDDTGSILTVEFSFPLFSRNISLKEFAATLNKCGPFAEARQSKVTSAVPVAQSGWKTALFGESPTPLSVTLNMSVTIISLLAMYAFIFRNFFPGDEWLSASHIIAAGLSILASSAFLWAYFKKKLKPLIYQGGRGLKLFRLTCIPLLIWVMLWVSITFGFAGAYTRLLGEESSVQILASKKDGGSTSKACIVTMDKMKTGFLREICLRKEHYNAQPKIFWMTMEGKKSWFGFSFDGYRMMLPRSVIEQENGK